jgi:hypothetical protein
MSKPYGETVRQVPGRDEWHVPGVDFGAPLQFRQDTDDVLVMEVPAHSVWGGRGNARQYRPARLLVYCILDRNDDRTGYAVMGLTEISLARTKVGAEHA